MTRVPPLQREEMTVAQQVVYDRIAEKNGRVGYGPAIGYAYSAEVWRLHSESSAHLLDCSLTQLQVRIISLLTVSHWRAPYPWAAQAKGARSAGLDEQVIEAINRGDQVELPNPLDQAVYDMTLELLSTGTLSQESFTILSKILDYQRMADIVGAIGHFCTTALMANVVGVDAPPDSKFQLRQN